MNKIRILVLSIGLASLSSGSAALAASSAHPFDLSNGIVFPDTSYAVFENPAGLPLGRSSVFHAGLVAGSGEDSGFPPVLLTYTGGRQTAFGLGVHQFSDTVRLSGGLGHSFGAFQAGLTASTFVPSNGGFDLGVDLGLRYELGSGPAIALVIEDVTGGLLDSWTFGLGWKLAQALTAETDLLFSGGNDSFGFDRVRARAALSANATDISFLLGYDMQIVPEIAGGDIRVGVNFWATRSFGVYGMYNSFYGGHVLGVKLQI